MYRWLLLLLVDKGSLLAISEDIFRIISHSSFHDDDDQDDDCDDGNVGDDGDSPGDEVVLARHEDVLLAEDVFLLLCLNYVLLF